MKFTRTFIALFNVRSNSGMKVQKCIYSVLFLLKKILESYNAKLFKTKKQ